MIFVEPNFLILDGTSNTFNDHDEHTYLGTSNISVPSAGHDAVNQSNATVITGFSARSSDLEAESMSFTISYHKNIH